MCTLALSLPTHLCTHTTCSHTHNANTFQTHTHTNIHSSTPMYAITHTQSLAPLPLSLATQHTNTATFTSDGHTQCKPHAHQDKLCKFIYTSLPLFPSSLTYTHAHTTHSIQTQSHQCLNYHRSHSYSIPLQSVSSGVP